MSDDDDPRDLIAARTGVDRRYLDKSPPRRRSAIPFTLAALTAAIGSPAGRVWVAQAVSQMKDPAKIAQGLAWLSYGCQREISFNTLGSVA